MRAQLVKAIHEDPNLLLLDEPTNFLDMEAIAYLEEKVKEMQRVIVVYHDRSFLDSTTSRIFFLKNQRVVTYSGNYSKFVEQKEAQIERQRRKYEV